MQKITIVEYANATFLYILKLENTEWSEFGHSFAWKCLCTILHDSMKFSLYLNERA